MEKGFIMISRKLFSHRIWRASRTFSECEAWIDLIQSARFEATVTIERIGGRNISYGRGQYPASISFLAQKWGWKSEKKVRNFLDTLRKEGMITTDCSQGMNIITLCNYDIYNTPDNEPKGKEEGKVKDLTISYLNYALGELRASIMEDVGKCLDTLKKEGQGWGNNNKKEKKNKEISPKGDKKKDAVKTAPLSQEISDSVDIELSDCKKMILSDKYWIEAFCMNNSINLERFNRYIDDFFKILQNRGETKKSAKDAKFHFSSWLHYEMQKQSYRNDRYRNSNPTNLTSTSGYGEE